MPVEEGLRLKAASAEQLAADGIGASDAQPFRGIDRHEVHAGLPGEQGPGLGRQRGFEGVPDHTAAPASKITSQAESAKLQLMIATRNRGAPTRPIAATPCQLPRCSTCPAQLSTSQVAVSQEAPKLTIVTSGWLVGAVVS